jgi:predicted O-methyltransferase YrrM
VKWADRIRNPPSRIDKLDVKRGQFVLFVGVRDATLREEIETRGATVLARGTEPVDVIFIAANERADLDRLETVQKFVKRDGAIWVVRPKGSPHISESDVIAGGRRAELVDVKVVRYSETHTAHKFVKPVSKR